MVDNHDYVLISTPKHQKLAVSKSRYMLAKKLNMNVQADQLEEKHEILKIKEKNLFNEVPAENEFKGDLGPRYNLNGDLIKYTVVGKSDWFLHQQQGKKQNYDESIQKYNRQKSKQIDDEKQFFAARAMETRRSMVKKLSDCPKKLKINDSLKSRSQINDEINSIKNRIDENRRREQRDLLTLDPLVQRYHLRDQRVLESHRQTTDAWDAFIQRTSMGLDRKPEMSQYYGSDAYRSKVEIADSLESMKSDAERIGRGLWYMTLRKPDIKIISQSSPHNKRQNINQGNVEDDQAITISITDLPQGFIHSSLNGSISSKNLQYIRKPAQVKIIHNSKFSDNQSSILNKTNSVNQSQYPTQNQTLISPYHSFHSNVYLKQKMDDLSSSNGKRVNIDYFHAEDSLVNLMVQGQGQFDREARVAYNYGLDNGLKKFVNPDQNEQVHEVIVSNYSYRDGYFLPPGSPEKKMRKTQLQFKHLPSIKTVTTTLTKETLQQDPYDSQKLIQ